MFQKVLLTKEAVIQNATLSCKRTLQVTDILLSGLEFEVTVLQTAQALAKAWGLSGNMACFKKSIWHWFGPYNNIHQVFYVRIPYEFGFK